MLDPCTFGDSRAAKILVKILVEHPISVARKASRLFCRYNHGLNQLVGIKDANIRITLLKLWLDFHIQTIKQGDFPEGVDSYLSNVMSKGYKNVLKEAQVLRSQQRTKFAKT